MICFQDKSGVAVTELAVSWQYSPHSELTENSPVYWVVGYVDFDLTIYKFHTFLTVYINKTFTQKS